jgi:WD40 repeat protein
LSGIKLTELYVGYTRKCKSILFSPDGGEIVCLSGRPGSGKGKELIIFNTLTGADLVILRGHELEISSVSWSPDGRYLASGSEDKSVRIWDAISGSQLAVLLGHEDAVTSVEWSSDGGRVVSRTDGAVMRIWDIATGECVRKQSREEDIHANLSVPASISIRAFVRGSETIIEDTVTRSPIAFYPVPIGSICTHPTGRILAGSIAFSTVFCLITIEGGILPLVSMNQTSAGT